MLKNISHDIFLPELHGAAVWLCHGKISSIKARFQEKPY